MILPSRHLVWDEQPVALAKNLKQAIVLSRDNVLRQPSRVLTSAQQLFRTGYPIGVPHGVRSAIVLARGIRIKWYGDTPRIYFCESHDFRVVEESILDGDDLPYPDPRDVTISTSCHVPQWNGYAPARLRISLNGHTNVHIEQFRYALAPLARV